MSTALRDGIQRLEVTSRVTLGVLALGSGVYTYLGVHELLNGNSTVVFFAAVIYSFAVTIGIFAFWSFLMRLLPHVLDQVGRVVLLFVMPGQPSANQTIPLTSVDLIANDRTKCIKQFNSDLGRARHCLWRHRNQSALRLSG